MKTPIIAIVTDFGQIDPFVGIMKGVILEQAPDVTLVDITNEIPAGDVQRAAVALWQSVEHFPPGTVFLCVVDPGVGSERRPVVLEADGKFFVGPDNGLFSLAAPSPQSVHEIKERGNPAQMSATFHGRDIFAPAAAAAALGKPLTNFGPPLSNLHSLQFPHLRHTTKTSFEGEILHADYFGNLLTSLGRFSHQAEGIVFNSWLSKTKSVLLPLKSPKVTFSNHAPLPLVLTFSDIPPGQTAALVGSTGLLEIAANQASAQAMTGLVSGERVKITFKTGD